MKPVIGITTFCENRSGRIMSSLNYNYVKSVYNAGGIPVLIPVIASREDAANYVDAIDGILFSGGNDISPMLYGENPIKEVVSISDDRDMCEFELFKEAMDRDMPVLGICRGVQLINAASGGSLYQDIHVQLGNVLGHSPGETMPDNLYHTVKLDKNSKLYDIFNKEEMRVNSFHHQAVKEVAQGFKANAKSPDGIIEGIESTEKTFVVGVQWHPEGLAEKHGEFLKLFKALVDEAEKHRRTRGFRD